MKTICDRKNRSIENYFELNDTELYCARHLPYKQFYMHVPNISLLKKASDPCDFQKSEKIIGTYADYFENTVSNIHIRRDEVLATMKGIKKARINYLKCLPMDVVQDKNDSKNQLIYYPIELLCYAPLNRLDFELIYKLPSILVRISQLYNTERLRKLFADNLQCYSVSLICVFII